MVYRNANARPLAARGELANLRAPDHSKSAMKALDIALLLVGVALLLIVLTTHVQSLWLAVLALAARAGVAVWALAKRRRAATS